MDGCARSEKGWCALVSVAIVIEREREHPSVASPSRVGEQKHESRLRFRM